MSKDMSVSAYMCPLPEDNGPCDPWPQIPTGGQQLDLSSKMSPVLKMKLTRGKNSIETDMLQPLTADDMEWVRGLWDMLDPGGDQ